MFKEDRRVSFHLTFRRRQGEYYKSLLILISPVMEGTRNIFPPTFRPPKPKPKFRWNFGFAKEEVKIKLPITNYYLLVFRSHELYILNFIYRFFLKNDRSKPTVRPHHSPKISACTQTSGSSIRSTASRRQLRSSSNARSSPTAIIDAAFFWRLIAYAPLRNDSPGQSYGPLRVTLHKQKMKIRKNKKCSIGKLNYPRKLALEVRSSQALSVGL